MVLLLCFHCGGNCPLGRFSLMGRSWEFCLYEFLLLATASAGTFEGAVAFWCCEAGAM